MDENLISFAKWVASKVESTGTEDSIEPVLEALDAYRDGVITLADLQNICLPEGLMLRDHIEALRLAESYMTLAEDDEEETAEEVVSEDGEETAEEAPAESEDAPFEDGSAEAE